MEVEAERKEIRNFARELHLFFPDFFHSEGPVICTRAPGRLDVMGGIADYSGSLVLELPLAQATFAAAQLRRDRKLVVASWNAREEGWKPRVEIDLRQLWQDGQPIEYRRFRELVGTAPGERWARYVLGGPLALAQHGLIPEEVPGVSLAIRSTVPAGAGVSSSASLEVAALLAFCTVWKVRLEPLQLALLAQEVENHAVGAPCGVMDQVTATLGKKDQLIAVLCQPAEVVGYASVPRSLAFFGIDTGVKHSVAGERYTSVRVATFMGRKIIEHLRAEKGEGSIPKGYLCNISPQEFVTKYRPFLPAAITGAEFLARYGPTGDRATSVDPTRTYRVRSRTEHPIRENARVQKFKELLDRSSYEEAHEIALEAGKLMFASHWSYSKLCGLGAKEADYIVRMVRELGPSRGLYGAKITGGGSGGTVAILAKRGAEKEVRRLAERYRAWTGRQPTVFHGSSNGAWWVGAVVV